MYQSVTNNRSFAVCDIEKKYLIHTINVADKLISNDKFGLNIDIDKLKFIKLKRLFNVLNNFNSDNCLCGADNQKLNKLNQVVKLQVYNEPIWDCSTPESCAMPKDLTIS